MYVTIYSLGRPSLILNVCVCVSVCAGHKWGKRSHTLNVGVCVYLHWGGEATPHEKNSTLQAANDRNEDSICGLDSIAAELWC